MTERFVTYRRGDVLFRLSDPEQYADAEVREIVASRNEATVANVCALCGASGTDGRPPNRAQRRAGITSATMLHEPWCVLTDDAIRELFARKGVRL